MLIKGRRITIGSLLFPIFLIAIAAAAWYWRSSLFAIFGSGDKIRAAVRQAGPWGSAVFIGLQIIQVIIFVLPGEIVQIAGGYIFGISYGSLLSIVGIALGSMFDFAVARLLGRPFVSGLFGEAKLARFAVINESPRAETAFFLLFVIPGIPKDALCFIAGLSPMKLRVFLAVSMIGRLPGILGSSLMGAAVQEGRIAVFIAVAAVATVLFVLGLIYREAIHDFITARFHRRRPADGSAGRAGSGEPD